MVDEYDVFLGNILFRIAGIKNSLEEENTEKLEEQVNSLQEYVRKGC